MQTLKEILNQKPNPSSLFYGNIINNNNNNNNFLYSTHSRSQSTSQSNPIKQLETIKFRTKTIKS